MTRGHPELRAMATQPALALLLLLLPAQIHSEPEATSPIPTPTLGSNVSASQSLPSSNFRSCGLRPVPGSLILLVQLAALVPGPALH